MDIMSEDPHFTGSCSQYQPAEVIQTRVPFRISISMVDHYKDGKITGTFFDWSVTLNGGRVAERSIYKPLPRTRGAAVRAARLAIKSYSEFLTSIVHKM